MMLDHRALGKKSFRRVPQWLALLAMLIQFVASYGHLHPEDFDSMTRGHGTPTLSADHGNSRALGDPLAADLDCPICAAMALLSSSVLPEAAHIVPPLAPYLVVVATPDELWLTPSGRLLFDPRGPPLA